MAEQTGQPMQSASGRPRLGGFEIGVRDSTFSQQGAVLAVHASGVPGTSFAGYPATCYCRQFPADFAAAIAATPWFSTASSVRHDRITPLLESGLSGQTAYFVEPAVSGERISQRLSNNTETTPAQVGRMLTDILEGLAVAWQAGFDLAIGPDTVRILPNARAQVSLALSMCLNPKPGAGADAAAQYQLSSFAAMVLSGKSDLTPLGIERLSGPDRVQAIANFRERMGNLSEHVTQVLAKALNADPAQRYENVQAFLSAFGQGLKATADELAFGAIEAKNSDTAGMASIYAEFIKRYDENHPELVGPGGRLNTSFHEGMQVPTAAQIPTLPPAATISSVPSPHSSGIGGESQLAPEIVAMLSGPSYAVSKPKNNPWFTFAAGMVFLVAIFMALAFLVLTSS